MSNATALARARVLSTRMTSRAEPRCITAIAQAEPTAQTPTIPTLIPAPARGQGRLSSLARRRERFQEAQGRHKEEVPGDRATEVQQAIVVAWRPTDEHVLQHLLGPLWRARVADEVGPVLAMRRVTEWHVVANDLDLLAILIDRGHRAVRGRGLDRVVELDIGQLGAADDPLLRFRGERVPGGHIVEGFLHDQLNPSSKLPV